MYVRKEPAPLRAGNLPFFLKHHFCRLIHLTCVNRAYRCEDSSLSTLEDPLWRSIIIFIHLFSVSDSLHDLNLPGARSEVNTHKAPVSRHPHIAEL